MANTTIKHASLNLTDEEWDKLEILSALDFSYEQIAIYFNINKTLFKQISSDPNSFLSEKLEAGKIKQDADERLALYDLARGGDVPAQKQIHEIKRTRAFKISKMDIFGSFENKKVLESLNDYLQSGATMDISVEEQLYIDTLIFMRDMDNQYGRRATVDFFVKNYKLKHQRASEMYDEAVNLFYGNRNINKKALRHKYAERLENAANVVAANAESSRDWEVYGNLMKQAATMQELDKPDIEKLPKEIYLPTTKVYTLDPNLVGLPSINRNELAAEIDALDQPESVKSSLRQDAMIDQIDIIAKFDRIEEEYKK
ncbi:hypothetical protein HP439_14750 [Sphingobacterium shayense]|uniref:hypothetical protein n=1 Tax=Sphingobacterium shayense TaxID=626343 RepID=UPI001555A689|nr:hypothetical protein [Sphingobacterium shayense]NQD71983.1 hypothetical protein [Sphingobacterium shayense]